MSENLNYFQQYDVDEVKVLYYPSKLVHLTQGHILLVKWYNKFEQC